MKKKVNNKTRKQLRKESRIAKKARKHEFFSNKGKKPNAGQKQEETTKPKFQQSSSKKKKEKPFTSLLDDNLKELKMREKQTKDLQNQMKKKRLKQLKDDAVADDVEIGRLEKLLGLKKKKEKAKSNFFASDGLDYLLDVCDRSKLQESVEVEKRFNEEDSDFDDDLANVLGKKPEKTKKKESQADDSGSEIEENLQSSGEESEVEEELSEIGEDESEDEGDFNMSDSASDAFEDDEMEESPKRQKSDPEQGQVDDSEDAATDNDKDDTWEDIYGRVRDKAGNVVTKYQPPHLRNAQSKETNEKLSRLKKQMKGLLNRLAENNMVSISSQIETLFNSNSRNDMNDTIWKLFRESLVAETDTPDRLVAEHAMLLAILSANVGGEVSAYCLQKCVQEWHQLWTAGALVGDKRTNNVLLLLSYMYHFKLFHCTLLYDILSQLLEKVEEKEVELILLVLRTVGFSLRKEDPVRLKDFVVKAQSLANKTGSVNDGSRIKFLLEVILAIKNNNMTKIPNYNPEYADHLKKTLKSCIRKGNYNTGLKITLDDLLKADERGRWWVVGSAWTGELPGEKPPEELSEKKRVKTAVEGFSSKLLELAKKQRMNTDTRRAVFCAIMSAEDYLDAFEKLVKLGLKGPAEREIMNVLLHCLLQEREYNPYYEHLARKFCLCDRRFQVMLQFATWDRIQELKSLKPTQVTNLAKFLGHLILEKNLAISVLKVVEFGQLDKPSVRFIRQVLLAILMADSEEAIIAAFTRIAAAKNLKMFREGLRLFLHHFVLRKSKDVEDVDMASLTNRVKLADSALSAADRSIAF